ncbi:hypothetical protein [Peribacillus sp. NPDC097295]|uniref:hypothetical protein n=1 Tax=Peribacillus sp. NPDC097295 TaxID=3364402 RepID=UPI00382D6AD2
MKKVLILIIFTLSFVIIDFSGLNQTTIYAKTHNVQKLVDKQLEVVKKKKIKGYVFYEAYPVKFTGKEISEIVVSSYGFEKDTNFINKTLLQVYQYDSTKKNWKLIKKFTSENEMYTYRPLRFITKGKLMDNKREQLVVGHVWGSDFSLTPILYGSTDGKTIKTLISPGDEGFVDGNAIIKNKELFFVDFLSSVSKRYMYKKGKFVQYDGTGADDRKIAGNAKHLLLLERRNGTMRLDGNKQIKMKVGESFSIIRKGKTDHSDYIFRMYTTINKNGPLKNTGGALKAVKPGQFEMSILLNDRYGPSLPIKITVVK